MKDADSAFTRMRQSLVSTIALVSGRKPAARSGEDLSRAMSLARNGMAAGHDGAPPSLMRSAPPAWAQTEMLRLLGSAPRPLVRQRSGFSASSRTANGPVSEPARSVSDVRTTVPPPEAVPAHSPPAPSAPVVHVDTAFQSLGLVAESIETFQFPEEPLPLSGVSPGDNLTFVKVAPSEKSTLNTTAPSPPPAIVTQPLAGLVLDDARDGAQRSPKAADVAALPYPDDTEQPASASKRRRRRRSPYSVGPCSV